MLLATGRVPNVKGLGLELASVDYSESDGIYANDFLETTNPQVYALGDCLALANNKALAEKMPGSGPQFTHNSDVQARAVVKNAFSQQKVNVKSELLPWTTYTDPELSHVGKYPHELRKLGIEFDTWSKFYERLDRAHCEGKQGMLKILTKKGTDEILGASAVGGPAGELIMTLATGMRNGQGLSAIGAGVYPYPSWSEGIKHLADQYNRSVKEKPKEMTIVQHLNSLVDYVPDPKKVSESKQADSGEKKQEN